MKIQKKDSIAPFSKFLVMVPLLSMTIYTAAQASLAQSSPDYHPGEAIKFHDLSGGTSSTASNSSTSSPVSSSSGAVQNNSASISTSSQAGQNNSNPNQDAAPTGEKGLGSLFKKVIRQELQGGGTYPSNRSYGGSPQNYINSQLGSQPQYSQPQNVQRPGHMYFTRPDAVQQSVPAYAQNNFHSNGAGAQQNGPRIGSNVMEFVTSNPPVPMSSDIECFFPSELHAKAYGGELGRNGPMNGAEDNDHLY